MARSMIFQRRGTSTQCVHAACHALATHKNARKQPGEKARALQEPEAGQRPLPVPILLWACIQPCITPLSSWHATWRHWQANAAIVIPPYSTVLPGSWPSSTLWN